MADGTGSGSEKTSHTKSGKVEEVTKHQDRSHPEGTRHIEE